MPFIRLEHNEFIMPSDSGRLEQNTRANSKKRNNEIGMEYRQTALREEISQLMRAAYFAYDNQGAAGEYYTYSGLRPNSARRVVKKALKNLPLLVKELLTTVKYL